MWARNVTRVHTHMHTRTHFTGPRLQGQSRTEMPIFRASHANRPPLQSWPWAPTPERPFPSETLAAPGAGDNIPSLASHPHPHPRFLLPKSPAPWATSPCPSQPAHSGQGLAREQPGKICRARGEEGDVGGRSCLACRWRGGRGLAQMTPGPQVGKGGAEGCS